MTEPQWFSSTNPHEMLAFLNEGQPRGLASLFSWIGLAKGKISKRKRQLFACGCCRRIWTLLADQRSRHAIEIAHGDCQMLVALIVTVDGNRKFTESRRQPGRRCRDRPGPGGPRFSGVPAG